MSKKLMVKAPSTHTRPKYKVSDYGTVLLPHDGSKRSKGTLSPGEVVPPNAFSPDQLKDHVKSGYIIRVGHFENMIPGIPLPRPIGTKVTRRGSSSDDVREEGLEFKQAVTYKDVPLPSVNVVGRWNLNPALLEPKTLTELREMISSRDPRMVIPDTSTGCIDQLSRDFSNPEE